MELSTTFTTSPKTIMSSYRACHRVGYLVRCFSTVALLALAIVGRSLVVAIFAGVYFGFAEWSVRRQLKPYLGGSRSVTVTMTDDEYRTQGADRATSRTWTTFTKVQRVGAFWVLRISNAAALGLPVEALDENQTSDFLALVRSKGLLAGEP